MAKPYPGRWILRTLLFTAGHIDRYIEKAFATDADCIVLDLEDAVPESKKAFARDNIVEHAKRHRTTKYPILVRINPLESGMTLLDLDRVACQEIGGFVYPKAYCAADVEAFDSQLTLKEKTLGLEHGHFEIIVLMETPQAILKAFEIATASSRVIGLLFGSEDFLTDMEGFHGPDGRSMLCARHIVAMAARAAGIAAIDTPYVQVHDIDGLKVHIQQAKELGYEGMLVMTPRQIEVAREMYTPAKNEVEEAREMVKLAEEAAAADRGIAVSKGVFISPPTLKRQKRLLSRYEAIEAFEEYRGF
ncbi:MAG: CoA ester lyase [Anaerolineae bacterium]|nr:CoA ester lyase [Anaerolineae bacterium]